MTSFRRNRKVKKSIDRSVNRFDEQINTTEIPTWTYDGFSTFQEHDTYSDIYLHPVAMYKDPFLGEDNILVLCETYYKLTDEPTESNKRRACLEVVKKCMKDDPWFGFEQVNLS